MIKIFSKAKESPLYKCMRCKDIGEIIYRDVKLSKWYKEYKASGKAFELGEQSVIDCPDCNGVS